MPSRVVSKGVASALTLVWVMFALWMVAGWLSVLAVAQPSSRELQSAHGYDIRAYDPQLAAQVSVSGLGSRSHRDGLRALHAYLWGDNVTQESIAGSGDAVGVGIASEAPVVTQQREDGVWLVSLIMPRGLTDATVPRPNDPSIRIVQSFSRAAAVLRFSGRADADAIARREALLRTALERDRVQVAGPARTLHYGATWVPSFLRQNEVLIPIVVP